MRSLSSMSSQLNTKEEKEMVIKHPRLPLGKKN